MKKKVLAFLLASAMVIEPFSVASAADFSDGMGQDTVQFSDDAEDVPEVESDVDGVDQFSTDAVGEGESSSKPSEDAIQMGDDVWMTYDSSTKTVTISGTGAMWDYYIDGWDAKKEHRSPFWNMQRNVSKIEITDGITSVGNYLFNGNSSLNDLSIGKDVKRIGAYAFASCPNISSVILPDGLIELGKSSFRGTGITDIKIPQSIEIWGEYSFSDCVNLKNVFLPSSLQKIPMGCFRYCSNLSKIQIPDSVSYLGENAFSNCISLTEVNLPSSLNNQPYMLFSGCLRLEKVKFGEGFSNVISQRMFENCESLKSIELVNGVQSIEASSFEGCTELAEITIPQSIGRIDESAFSECNKLQLIKGYKGSYAETFAKNNGFTFESIGNVKETLQLRNVYCEWQYKERSKVNVRCTSNKDGYYYTIYVKKGSSAPDYDASKKDGTVKANNQIYVNITDLPEEEVDIYVFVTDDDGNYASVKIIPDYYNRPKKPQDTIFPVKVGKDIMASLDGDVLTLTGSGTTYDYNSSEDMDMEFCQNSWLTDKTLSQIKRIVIGEKISRIGDSVFAGCNNLEEISFPTTLTQIGDGTFEFCSSLKEFDIPEGVESLGDSSLYGCSSIEKNQFSVNIKRDSLFCE